MADTPTVDMTATGTGTAADPKVITATVIVDPASGPLLTAGAAGLLVTCEAVQDCVGNAFGDGLIYNDALGTFAAKISGDAGNGVVFGGDGGLYAPAGTALAVLDTPTVDLTLLGNTLSAAVIVDPVAGNVLTAGPAGLLVSCEAVQDCVGNAFGPGLTYNDALNTFQAHVSTDPGNSVSLGGDGGLFVPPGGAATITTADTACINLTGDGSGATPLSADPIIQPGATNLLSCTPTGLAVLCEAVQDCVGAGFTQGLLYDDALNQFRARIDPVVGNTITQSAAGLLVPAAVATVTTGPCGVSGTGTPGDPVVAKVAAWPFPCPQNAANATEIFCDPATGQLQGEPPSMVAQDQQFINVTHAAIAVPAADTLIQALNLTVNNPSTCKVAFSFNEFEVDADFTLPSPNSTAEMALDADVMYRVQNTGAIAQTQVHAQGTKVTPGAAVPAGGSVTITNQLRMRGGSGGATYTRDQLTGRVWVIAL